MSEETKEQVEEKVAEDVQKEVSAEEKVAHESDLRDGVKIAANNPEVMGEIEDSEGDDFDEQPPSFFVEEDDRTRIEVDILHDPKTGKIVSISKLGIVADFSGFNALKHSKEWVEFMPPTYDNMAAYRQKATITTAEGRRLIDRTSLRNFLIVRHLKDWSFRGRNGEKVELSFKDNGTLDEESIERVYSVPPTIIDVVLTIFEKDILLT